MSLLASTACQGWAAPRADLGNTADNPTESQLTFARAGSLRTSFTADLGHDYDQGQIGWEAPVVSDGLVYVVGVAGVGRLRLSAFPEAADGTCIGAPLVCPPRWTADLGVHVSLGPVVSGGRVFVATGSATTGELFAFDAAGNDGCGGTPRTCQPLWTGTGGSFVQATVADGVVFTADPAQARVEAFDAAGAIGCGGSPRSCQPMWTTSTVVPSMLSIPAVADGTMYVVQRDGTLVAFDASGAEGCGGVPKVCAPRWTAPPLTPGRTDGWAYGAAAPVVTGGRVFVNVEDGAGVDRLAAFDAAGATGCSGTPVTCAPLWSTALDGYGSEAYMAASGTTLFVQVSLDGRIGRIEAFDQAGGTCAGSPQHCTPGWTAPHGVRYTSPSVANGVVYAVGPDPHVYAIDGRGQAGCIAEPPVCSGVALPFQGVPVGPVAIADGKLFAITWHTVPPADIGYTLEVVS